VLEVAIYLGRYVENHVFEYIGLVTSEFRRVNLANWPGCAEENGDAHTGQKGRNENTMGINDRYADISGEQPRVAALDLGLDVDRETAIRRILSETRKATEDIRHSTEALCQSPLSASGTGAEIIAETQAQAVTIGAEAQLELPAADFVIELEKLANGLSDMTGGKVETETPLTEDERRAQPHVEHAADPEELLRNLWAEHGTLTETFSRLRAAVAEADSSIDAFRHAMKRFEEATGDMMGSSETDTSRPPSPADGNGTVAAEHQTESLPDLARDRKQTALAALSSL
jgi:hypothetical protein